jgi:hypothetical protein
MDCERCATGKMEPIRGRRFSNGLVTLGYVLWVPAAAILILGTLTGFVSGGRLFADRSGATQARQLAADALRRIDGVPPDVVTEFATTGTIARASINRLGHEQQLQLQAVLQGYRTSLSSIAARDPVTTALGSLSGPLAFLLIPVGVTGWILTRRKTLWRCSHCLHVADPA